MTSRQLPTYGASFLDSVRTEYNLARNSKMASLWNYISLPNAVFTSPVAAILTPVTAGALVGYTTTSGEYGVLLVAVAPRQKTY